MKAFIRTIPLIVALGAALRADCIDGSRETTEAEKQFYIQTVTTLKGLVPAAPAGWKLEDRNQISAPGSVCAGSGKLPLRSAYEIRYYWLDGIAELRKKEAEFDKRIAELRRLPADKQQEFDETGRKGRDLERQARKLMATDKAEAEKLIAESRELSRKAHEIRQAHLQSIGAQITAIVNERQEATKDINTEIRLRIGANGYNLQAPEGAQKTTRPGAVAAWQGPKQTVVAFGAWSAQGAGLKPVYSAGPTTRVQNVVLEVTGKADQVTQLLAGMNADSIGSILTR